MQTSPAQDHGAKVQIIFHYCKYFTQKPQKYSIGSNFSTEWLDVANANRVVSEGVAYL